MNQSTLKQKANETASAQLAELNQSAYLKEDIVSHYLAEDTLQAPEETIFQELNDKISGKKILDIGVGGGRTSSHLLKLSSNYTGVDISKKMIDGCKTRYPDAEFIQCDARDMSQFKDASYDLVLFSFNGIDYVSHEDRLIIFREIKRLLSPNGYFVFSTHNRDWNKLRDVLYSTKNPIKLAIHLKRYLAETLSQQLNRSKETHCEAYSISYDLFENETLMTYCISIKEQLKQLQALGFSGLTKIYSHQTGQKVKSKSDTHSPWSYYCIQNS